MWADLLAWTWTAPALVVLKAAWTGLTLVQGWWVLPTARPLGMRSLVLRLALPLAGRVLALGLVRELDVGLLGFQLDEMSRALRSAHLLAAWSSEHAMVLQLVARKLGLC